MKYFVLLFALVFNFSLLISQTLFTYGSNVVSKQEFLKAYNKNKNTADNQEKALREYLDLYSKFKLKVKAAHDAGLDKLPQINADLKNFKSQIEETYLSNEDGVNQLTNEAFENAKTDVEVYHFFVPLNNTDSAKADNAMKELYSKLATGSKEYDNLTKEISAKYVPIKSSNIGFITAFTLPYEYEKIIYSLREQEISKPYKSAKGIHLFKVTNKRPAMGKWRVAQILFAMPPGDDVATKKAIEQKADSVYLLLKNGGNFETLANNYSDDKLTYQSGGIMAEFTSGKFDGTFENEVFNLKKDGEISKPFFTPFGYHIVKRIAVIPVQTTKDDAAYLYEIKQKVLQDARINTIKDLFAKNITKLINYKKNTTVKDEDLFRYADSVAINPAQNASKVFPISNKIIFSTPRSKLTGTDWLNFVRNYKTNPEIYKNENNNALLQKFVQVKSMDYYKANLQTYNADFKYQMEEFKEGNLLFEIMERKVWSNAANDSIGLKKYYTEHKGKYLWGESAEVLIFNCNTKSTAEQTLNALNLGKNWKTIAEESENTVQADSGRYETNQIALQNNTKPAEGMISPINVNSTDGTAALIKLLKLYPANMQRSFEEARGLVINEYQIQLEEKWIAELKNKYPLKINEKVFQTLLK